MEGGSLEVREEEETDRWSEKSLERRGRATLESVPRPLAVRNPA